MTRNESKEEEEEVTVKGDSQLLMRQPYRQPLDGIWFRVPNGGVRPFHQKSTCITQFTLGPNVAQMWSRNTPKTSPNETHEAHREEGVTSGDSNRNRTGVPRS